MARTFTLATLRTAVRYRADLENSRAHSDAELNTYISASYAWLHDLLVDSGVLWFHSTTTITTTGAATYSLPSDCYRILRVRYLYSTDLWARVTEISPHDIDRIPLTGTRATWFQVYGSTIELFPTPPTGQTYQVRYIPNAADLTSDAQTVDGVNGWEELLIVDAAIKARRKTEEDTSGLERDRAILIDRIKDAASDRMIASTMRPFQEEPTGTEWPDPSNWRV